MNTYTPVDFWYESRQAKTSSTALLVLELLQEILKIESVVDIGCGVGTWLAAAKKNGASNIVGFDGNHVPLTLLEIHPSDFKPVDLTQEMPSIDTRFDLAISLEVAEHLPEHIGTALLDCLCAMSDNVLFSAAIPGQGGNGHINEQWQKAWALAFYNKGYQCYDFLRPQLWNIESVPSWYRQNIFLYSRRTSVADAISKANHTCLPPEMRNLVHPETFASVARRAEQPGIKRSVRHLKNAIISRLRCITRHKA